MATLLRNANEVVKEYNQILFYSKFVRVSFDSLNIISNVLFA